jgi:hypothetical protein
MLAYCPYRLENASRLPSCVLLTLGVLNQYITRMTYKSEITFSNRKYRSKIYFKNLTDCLE